MGGGEQMKSREAVVKRILELVENQNITINYLSTISAVPPTTLKNIVYGNTANPGIVTIAKLCDGLGITVNEFFSSDIFKNLEQEIE
jgi:transcriptional regulator with XRE-family HTH domain